jgi:probable F420-dependent oxidoreductase
MPPIRISVQAEPRDIVSWLSLARRAEAGGFEALLLGDHPGSGSAPWAALGSAAAVTNRLRLGTYVSQAGVREPMHLAADAASLDILAPGRVSLGVGAGHTPREWSDIGRDRPSPPDRAGRLVKLVDAVADLLDGRTITVDGRYLTSHDARLEDLPTGRVQLTVGGGHPEVLRVAARRADVVGLSGLGRTLPDGHRHEVRWSAAVLGRQLDLIRRECVAAQREPELEALVQVVTVADDRDAAIADLVASHPQLSAADLGHTPYALIGTHEQMAAQMLADAETWGITRYVVREPAVPDIEPVLSLLADPSSAGTQLGA